MLLSNILRYALEVKKSIFSFPVTLRNPVKEGILKIFSVSVRINSIKWAGCLLVFWMFSFAALSGIEFICESLDNQAKNMILIPYADLFFSIDQEMKNYDNQITLAIFTDDEEIVYQEQKQLTFSISPEELDSMEPVRYNHEFYPLQFTTELQPGEYQLYVSISDNSTTMRREYSESFIFPDSMKEVGYFFITAAIGDFLFILRDERDLFGQYDSLQVLQYLDFEPDSTYIRLEFDDRQELMEKDALQEIANLLQDETTFELTLEHYYRGKKYVSTPVYPGQEHFFRQEYTPKEQLAQLRYIMNQNEYHYLRSLPEDELQQGIDEFWMSKDPDPYTADNVYQETFYQRVRYADKNYRFRANQPGWRTDMGRIYITYGKPNQVSSDVFPIGRPPSITWYYYSLNKVFTFYDLRGYGQYELKEKWID